MTQEEKARAYDEVLNKLRHFITKGVDPLITRADVQDFFPELAESEDEKVRKALLEMVHDTTGDELLVDYNVHKEEALSWLERQAERKTPQWMIDFLDNYRRKIGCSLDRDDARDVEGKILCIMQWLENQGVQIDIANKEYWRGYREGKKLILDKYAEIEKQNGQDILEDAILDGNEDGLIAETIKYKKEKQGEKKPVIEMKTAAESLGIDSDTYNKIVDECIFGEQKPKENKGNIGGNSSNWSEEDEIRLNTIIHNITIDKSMCKYEVGKSICDEQINWLKSIKEKIGGKV